MSQLGRRQRETPTTILSLLTDQMDGVDGVSRRRRTLKERLGFTGMGCCGATWVFRSTTLTANNGRNQQPEQGEHNQHEFLEVGSGQNPNLSQPECMGPIASGSSSGMNLAAALAAEREIRGSDEVERVSLMRLLEETEEAVVVVEEEEKGGSTVVGSDSVCCVCMGRNKGAAFIPCGHTFCRVCSRELWLNRGSCPLCNHSILEILDIF